MKLIVRKDGITVGHIIWRYEGHWSKHKLVELTEIQVKEGYRRRGFATSLFQRMLEQIKGFRKLYLKTHADNTDAHRFYESLGMQYEATLADHFHSGVDEYIYSRYG